MSLTVLAQSIAAGVIPEATTHISPAVPCTCGQDHAGCTFEGCDCQLHDLQDPEHPDHAGEFLAAQSRPPVEENDPEIITIELKGVPTQVYCVADDPDFEGQHLAILTPLEAYRMVMDAKRPEDAPTITVFIYRVDGDSFVLCDDRGLNARFAEANGFKVVK